MIDRTLVVAAYQLLLGREPESAEVIEHHAASDNVRQLLEMFIYGDEFRRRFPGFTFDETWVWADTAFGCRLRVNLRDDGVSRNVIRQSFEPEETEVIRTLLRSGSTVLDIGANIGYFTMLMAQAVGPLGHVHAFEARPELAASITLSAAENGFTDRVSVHEVALSDRGGEAYMIYHPTGMNWGGAYLSFDGRPPYDHIALPVRTAPLADLVALDRVDFIKIDVEGAEPMVLSQIRTQLSVLRPTILSEIHAEQIRRVSGIAPDQYVRDICNLGYSCRPLQGGELPASFEHLIFNVVFEPL